MAHSSERISPKRFGQSITSNSCGRRSNCIAALFYVNMFDFHFGVVGSYFLYHIAPKNHRCQNIRLIHADYFLFCGAWRLQRQIWQCVSTS
jgi:hypothetical protein